MRHFYYSKPFIVIVDGSCFGYYKTLASARSKIANILQSRSLERREVHYWKIYKELGPNTSATIVDQS